MMVRGSAFKMLARLMAGFGLAAAITFGLAGPASAAPADRGDDPVVLRGSDVPTLNKVSPKKIIGFKWADGNWAQVPVQVDERHTISARTLYPEDTTSKYILPTTFDIEVYADPDTRSGADADAGFDADDELVFMAADSGGAAPSAALAPEGVDPAGATQVTVADPVGGGNSYVYLFAATGDADQSAGKDYVKYDFKLTNLAAGQNMKDNYGYSNTINPEDSTVTTANYQLHSTGRWMEDQMRISAGGASNTDILDREAVSAGGLDGCGRSEYTFSGNWDLDAKIGNERPDDDDEGTYVAVIDGPVRAIRDYMGANSGPYVESIHKYYADQEDKSIQVRVHPIPYMYVWTDYNENAIGMTYRDQLNENGVPIDGNPDTINQPAANSIQDGQYFWQQVSGSAGSVTTLVSTMSSNTDRTGTFSYDYAGYYLDDVTPTGASEKQCGGDLKAYGASGFGISGIFPNTDPNLAGAFVDTRSLSVNRVRYFGPPNATAADAGALRSRAQQPLTATTAGTGFLARAENLGIALNGRKPKARAGKPLRLKLKVTNSGTVPASSVKVCMSGGKLAGKPCKTVSSLGAGGSKALVLKTRVKKGAKGRKVQVQFSARTSASGVGKSISLRLSRKR